ncbi:Protein CBG01213 [Caenorhabditis briggsae]|uniref:Protein CBG01213 n=1 Tax=Caenorhabditis briggsae TaxID=6238 RepID=A8WPU9_CAEBR|nr:Protein CBG01213 [Caenorhabditis briggsae]CAP22507.1 Protein CBG01213 [Caenorhabditis briggsae]
MFGKSFLLLALVVAVSSLECVFEVFADPSSLNIQGGTDKCDAEDNYCLKVYEKTNFRQFVTFSCLAERFSQKFFKYDASLVFKIDFNGIKAKGCSRTSRKINGVGMQEVDCNHHGSGCLPDNSVCCCEGNKCNGVSEISAMFSIVIIGVARFFLIIVLQTFEEFFSVLLTITTATHMIICVFMSSQYRETSLSVVRCGYVPKPRWKDNLVVVASKT